MLDNQQESERLHFATAIGTEPVFGSVLAITLVMAWAAARIPDATEPEEDSLSTVIATLTSAPVMVPTIATPNSTSTQLTMKPPGEVT